MNHTNNPPSKDLLMVSLCVAVPMWIDRLRLLGDDELIEIVKKEDISQVIAEKGDILQYGGGKKGEVARAFNSMARGLAIMSFFPGGVTFCGEKFETIR